MNILNNFIKKFFSIKNEYKKYKKYKRITILGLKFKFKSPNSQEQQIDKMFDLINDLNFKQNLVMDYYLEAKNANKPKGILKEQHKLLLKLLVELDRIARENQINYWLDFGTLLGAIRHGGCIPWDDDMDIAMPAQDAEKFMQIAPNLLKEEFIMTSLTSSSRKVFRICFKKNNPTAAFSKPNGAFIDVFIYDLENGKYVNNHFAKKFKDPNHNYARGTHIDIVYPLKKVKFENIEFYAPNDFDNYLKIKYGNWHLLPKKAHFFNHGKLDEHKTIYDEV